METEAQRRANLKSRKKNIVKQVNVPLHHSHQDIVDWLDEWLNESGEGQAEYVRRLIREDMERRKNS